MANIDNYEALASSRERKLLLEILDRTMDDCDPKKMTKDIIKKIDDGIEIMGNSITFKDNDVYVIGAGRSAGHMAEVIDEQIGDYITKGLINTDSGHEDIGNIRVQRSSLSPTKQNINNTARMLTLAKKVKEDDIVIFLLSENTSNMLMHPAEGISQEELIETEKILQDSGLPEKDCDIIRKHISAVKGGRLAEAFGCRFYTIILSDKKEGDLSAIGASPSDCDISTFEDTDKIIKKNKLKLPKAVMKHIDLGKKGKNEDTPKVMPVNSKIFMAGSMFTILASASEHSQKRKIRTKDFMLEGNIEDSARSLCDTLRDESARPCIYIGYGKNEGKSTRKESQSSRFVHEVVKGLSDVKKPWAILSFNMGGDDEENKRGVILDGSQYEEVSKLLEDSTTDADKMFAEHNSLIVSEGCAIDLSDLVIAFLGTNWNKNRRSHKGKNNKRKKR